MVSLRDAPNLFERLSYVKNVITYNFDTVTAETKFRCSLFTALLFLGECSFSSSEHRNKTSLFSPSFPPSLPWPQQAPVIVSQRIYDTPERPSICSAPTQSAAVHSFEDRTEENEEKKKKKGSAQPQQILQTVLLFADLGGFHNNDDHNRRNEDLTKHGDWTTENIICKRRAHEPLLTAFTESPAQWFLRWCQSTAR